VNLRRAGENFSHGLNKGDYMEFDLIVSDHIKDLYELSVNIFRVRHGRDVRHILCEIFLIRHRSSYRKRFMVR